MIKLLNTPSLFSSLKQTVEICKKIGNEEIEIIVPDKLSLFMERFLFENLKIEASFNIKVSTLNRYAKKNLTVAKERQISSNGSILLVYKILNENYEYFTSLKSSRYSFTYAEDIYATISQLKASRITWQEMQNFSSSDVRLEGKIKDLALIYEKYEQEKAGLLDASDLFMMSVFSVAEGKENANLLFVGFDDFTAVEYAIIERLALVANVSVFNYYTNKANARIYNSEVCSQLKNIAYNSKLNFEVETLQENVSETKKFLQASLFGFDKEKFVLTNEAIKIFEGNNINEEFEFVARDIRNKVVEGYKFSNFGVAVFGLENKISKIKEIFEKYEINYYIDNNLTLNNSIFYKFLISVFKFNLNSHNLTYLLDIINSPFFIENNENKVKLINKLKLIKFVGNNLEKYDLGEELNEIKKPLIDLLNNLKFEKAYTVLNVIETLKIACENLKIDELLNSVIDNNLDLQNQMLIAKSKEMVINLLEDIFQFFPNADFETVVDIFSRMANVAKVNNLPLSLDCVKIVDATNTMEVFNNFYIVNCTADNAPTLKQDCGIILDNEIEKLNFAFKLSPTISHINKLAKLRLFNTLLLFENSLTITYSRLASDVVKELTIKLQINIDGNTEDLPVMCNYNIGKYYALSEWDYIEYLCRNDNKNKKLFEKLIKNKEFNEISQENLKIYKNFKTVSASQLESYFKCPFYAFLNNVLKIQPRLQNDILALDVGNILHEIMCEYYVKEKNVGDVFEFCKNKVFQFVENDERLKVNAKSPVLINLIDEAVRVINGLNYIDQNSLFQTNKKLLEVPFYGNNSLKLKNIELVGKIDRIDIYGDMARIIDYKSGKADATLKELYYGNKLQLFLYSVACEKWLKKSVVGSFYLPLHNTYTREVGNSYSLKGFFTNEEEIVKAFDTRLQPGEKSDIVNLRLTKENRAAKTKGFKELSSSEMLWLKEYSKAVSENAVDEIKSGFIKPTPSVISKQCDYCPYVHVCLRSSSNINYREAEKITPESFNGGGNEN